MPLQGQLGQTPAAPTGSTGTLERPVLITMAAVGALLIAGYVVLAALGRDTTGYVLFLGGPAMTSIVGAILTKRISHVQATVTETQAKTQDVLDGETTALHQHLADQDGTLNTISKAVEVLPAAAVMGAGAGGTTHPPPAPAASGFVGRPNASANPLPAARQGDESSSHWPVRRGTLSGR